MAKKPRIDLSPDQIGLSNPFSGLDLPGLPALPEVPVPPSAHNDSNEPKRPSKFGRVVLRREKAHRGGKTVIVIDDFAPNISTNYIESLAGKLKAHCGCGGTTKERAIEIQGDQPGRLRAFLEKEGFRVAGIS